MAVDTSIYGNLLRPPKSVAEYDADYESLQANKLQNALGRAKMDEYTRGVNEQNRLRSLAGGWSANTTDDQRIASLKNAGFFTQADALEKGLLERQKTGAEVGLKQADTAAKVATNYRQVLDTISTPQEAAQWLQAQYKDPVLGQYMQSKGPFEQALQTIPMDPQGFDQWRQRAAMGMEKYIQDQTSRRGQDVTANNAKMADERIRAEGAANRAVTMRGQNMTDARTRETIGATISKPFEVTGPDGLPVLVRQDKAGNITPVEGYGPKSGSAKPLNDTQAKALLFGTRMQEANKALESLQYSPAAINAKTTAEGLPLIGGIAGVAGNALLSEQDQQAEQAQRDFINAVLRRESGAVIADSEFANAKRQYFPQPNDKPATLEQKRRNRQLAIEGLLAEVPEGRRASITPKPAATPNIDSLLDKYK